MGRAYVYRSIARNGWMVVATNGRNEFGPYRWKWVARYFAWCINEAEPEEE